jgi:integrase
MSELRALHLRNIDTCTKRARIKAAENHYFFLANHSAGAFRSSLRSASWSSGSQNQDMKTARSTEPTKYEMITSVQKSSPRRFPSVSQKKQSKGSSPTRAHLGYAGERLSRAGQAGPWRFPPHCTLNSVGLKSDGHLGHTNLRLLVPIPFRTPRRHSTRF